MPRSELPPANFLYADITRARIKVILIGDPAAYAMAVRNSETAKRYTGLVEKFRLT